MDEYQILSLAAERWQITMIVQVAVGIGFMISFFLAFICNYLNGGLILKVLTSIFGFIFSFYNLFISMIQDRIEQTHYISLAHLKNSGIVLSPTTESELAEIGLLHTDLITPNFLSSVPSIALSITTLLIVIFITWGPKLKNN